MDIAADELLDELARIDATLQLVVRRAGDGGGPELERRLQAHLRRLRRLLCAVGVGVAVDTVDAAQRVLISAEPQAPRRVRSFSISSRWSSSSSVGIGRLYGDRSCFSSSLAFE